MLFFLPLYGSMTNDISNIVHSFCILLGEHLARLQSRIADLERGCVVNASEIFGRSEGNDGVEVAHVELAKGRFSNIFFVSPLVFSNTNCNTMLRCV